MGLRLFFDSVFNVKAVPKSRPRACGNRFYTPKKTVDFENYIALLSSNEMCGSKPSANPIFVEVAFLFETPKSWSKKKKKAALDGYHVSKPDIDNLEKSVFDALNGIVWIDDAQVFKVIKEKKYSQESSIQIKIYEKLP